jgi:hypothetical protein
VIGRQTSLFEENRRIFSSCHLEPDNGRVKDLKQALSEKQLFEILYPGRAGIQNDSDFLGMVNAH